MRQKKPSLWPLMSFSAEEYGGELEFKSDIIYASEDFWETGLKGTQIVKVHAPSPAALSFSTFLHPQCLLYGYKGDRSQ
jgi:hypothetical protein